MRGLKRFTRSVVPGVLAACVMSLGSPCAAQEPDPPTVPHGRGSVFAPSAWLVVNTPLRKEIALKSYGFYIGELDVPVAQFDLPIRDDEVPDHHAQLHVLLGSSKRAQRAAAAAGRVRRQLRRASVPCRRNRGVRRSQARDLRPQHVCPAVPRGAGRRHQPLPRSTWGLRIPSTFTAASGSPSPHTRRTTTRALAGTERDSGPVSRCPSTSAYPSSRPTCGKPAKGAETFTTCCSGSSSTRV